MSAIWLLVLAAGVTPFQPGEPSTAQPAAAVAATQAAAMAVSPAIAVVDPAARSPQQLRDAVTAALKKINGAKRSDRAAAITAMTDLYGEISHDRQLTQPERQRLAAQLPHPITALSAQLRYELAHAAAVARSSSANSGSASSQASLPTAMQAGAVQAGAVQAGAAGGPAAEGLDQLVDLIQMTLGGPDNWLPAQRAVNAPAGQGGAGFGVGMGGGGQNGNQGAGGGAGGFQQQGKPMARRWSI